MSNNIRKTQRKNKTNQVISWPSSEDYFTIDTLIATNQHMLTATGSDITLRVKLMKCVKEEPKTVAVIGTMNVGKGRPQLAFAMRPVKQSVLDKAKVNNIMLVNDSELISVMEVNGVKKTPTIITPTIVPIKITSSTLVSV